MLANAFGLGVAVRTHSAMPKDRIVMTLRGMPARKGGPFDGLLVHPDTWQSLWTAFAFDQWMDREEGGRRVG